MVRFCRREKDILAQLTNGTHQFFNQILVTFIYEWQNLGISDTAPYRGLENIAPKG